MDSNRRKLEIFAISETKRWVTGKIDYPDYTFEKKSEKGFMKSYKTK